MMRFRSAWLSLFQLDYVKRALLALSAVHVLNLSDSANYRLSELYHLDRALLSFRQRLATPIDPDQVDAVCTLLNTEEFSLNKHPLSKSWLVCPDSYLHWLTVHAGQKSLMLQCRGFAYSNGVYGR